MGEDRSVRRTARRVFGRRKGPALSGRKLRLLAEDYPRFAIPRPLPAAGMLDPQDLFPRPMAGFVLEIGFGKGEHLVAAAQAAPDCGFIGCEPYLNGLVAGLDGIMAAGLGNVRLYDDDARHVLDALRDASLDRVELIHPDPWPKRRHARRRFIGPENLDVLARVLRPGGTLLVVTDDPVYRRWTAIQMSERHDFEWLAARACDWSTPPPGWVGTRYQRKAARAGRADTFFRFRRRAGR